MGRYFDAKTCVLSVSKNSRRLFHTASTCVVWYLWNENKTRDWVEIFRPSATNMVCVVVVGVQDRPPPLTLGAGARPLRWVSILEINVKLHTPPNIFTFSFRNTATAPWPTDIGSLYRFGCGFCVSCTKPLCLGGGEYGTRTQSYTPRCDLLCMARDEWLVNVLPQILQEKGLSLVWVRRCFTSVPFICVANVQKVHLKSRSTLKKIVSCSVFFQKIS